MKKMLSSILLLCLSGCATLSNLPRSVTLNKIEKLQISKEKCSEVENLLGKAEQIIFKANSEQLWIYKNSEGFQTASLTFNQECVLTGAVWLPGSPHEIISLQQALDYFKNSKFVAKKEGWDRQGHFYSDDTHYVDEQNGVTITINSSDQMVLQIGFSANTIRVAKP